MLARNGLGGCRPTRPRHSIGELMLGRVTRHDGDVASGLPSVRCSIRERVPLSEATAMKRSIVRSPITHSVRRGRRSHCASRGLNPRFLDERVERLSHRHRRRSRFGVLRAGAENTTRGRSKARLELGCSGRGRTVDGVVDADETVPALGAPPFHLLAEVERGARGSVELAVATAHGAVVLDFFGHVSPLRGAPVEDTGSGAGN